MNLKFWKMHGLGNDFVVIDNRDSQLKDKRISGTAKLLCERRYSIGADGLILLHNSILADAKMRIFNADGSEAEMCGNGIGCTAKYCYQNNIVRKRELDIETLAGVKRIWLHVVNEKVKRAKIDMGKPVLDRSNVPMLGHGTCVNEPLQVGRKTFKVTCLSIGNPHCVIFVDNVDTFPVSRIGPQIETHSLFPNKINVEFAQVLNNNELKVRVWERGCGETFACGTGACASVVAGNLLKKISNKTTVHLIGGDLKIDYVKKVFMTGSVEKVFEGEIGLGE